ncbi:4-hydroxybenzoate 3-monooxygenase [Pseudonocardia sp. CA-142604]|uniref:4-hydroxybenzoate 3-monooxygenase n=1 Tax=Pseudonocardia sp. CA-142604 TaxID=3240024 RepID=UPI003D8A4001
MGRYPDAGRAVDTSVAIVGAGVAGLTIGRLLRTAGVDCVVLETESREFIEQRPRAGFIEEWVVRALERHGLADGLLAHSKPQSECEFRLDGVRHVFRYAELSGQHHYVYPQQLLVTDLVRAYADDAGGSIRFGVTDVALHGLDTERPAVSYTAAETGARHVINCDFVAGCDGARGVSRQAVPEDAMQVIRHDLGIAWMAILAQAPPSSAHAVFGLHRNGLGAFMHRSPEISRYYLEVPPGDSPDNWPHERVWRELRERLEVPDARPLVEGELLEKRVLDMHNYVVEPLSYGRLHLAGDSAHLLAPIGAKGMNSALHDAFLLTDALRAHYEHGDDSRLAGYSEDALRRIWQYQEFNQWLSEVMHGPSSDDPFRARVAAARLRRMVGSEISGTSLAGLYIGADADH